MARRKKEEKKSDLLGGRAQKKGAVWSQTRGGFDSRPVKMASWAKKKKKSHDSGKHLVQIEQRHLVEEGR